jgi:transposase
MNRTIKPDNFADFITNNRVLEPDKWWDQNSSTHPTNPCYARYRSTHPTLANEQKPDEFTYRIEGALASLPNIRMEQLQRKSCFIPAINQLDMEVLSDKQFYAGYKGQQKVERGFRFMKDPMFMASTFFLKSTKRITALLMVMTICLLVYAALEYRIRQTLKEHNEYFPDQKGNEIQNPTTGFLFQFFAGIHILVIDQLYELVLNLNQYQLELLRLLGENYEQFYSDSG